ncbi:DUF4259 domain-containing protein [Pyxidicoccus xibeiensis]|uniref:DUF4259 domain-containing protein n=1 Tax=Pyxidicoccus xibeiensis TaxID=2906759 RepID=UPI0020A78280|nr:DUF4259 domain-containing protein [Pyxidicoccus xibeiensis]MCP3139190.1 DUF4259 domain-containing protein [Pyxidicoccus xibeiensis]
MGAWGSGNFENDAVLDWVSTLKGWQSVKAVLEYVARASRDAYLSANVCCTSLGAAEIVAACIGQPSVESPEAVKSWVAANRNGCSDELRSLATTATRRIEAESELQELFDEGARNEEWHAVVSDLLRRLSSA